MSEQRRTFDIAVITGIIAALVAFLGNVVVTYVQGRNQLRIEKSQHESALITKAITDDLETTTRMFKFYLGAGLVSDEEGRIAKFIENQENIPTLPSTGAIACYSHFQEGSSYSIGGNIYVMGIIDGIKGRYIGRIFHPERAADKDISKDPEFSAQCNARFPACKGQCWAGGDTGGFLGK